VGIGAITVRTWRIGIGTRGLGADGTVTIPVRWWTRYDTGDAGIGHVRTGHTSPIPGLAPEATGTSPWRAGGGGLRRVCANRPPHTGCDSVPTARACLSGAFRSSHHPSGGARLWPGHSMT
jgi:hypothetical protein